MVISRIKIHPLYVILPSHYFPSSSPPPAYRNSPPAFLLCDPIESFRYKSSTDRGVEERWKRCPSLFSLLSFLSSRVQPRRRFIERIRSWTTFHDSEREKGIIKNEPLPKMSRAHVCSRWRLCNAILVSSFESSSGVPGLPFNPLFFSIFSSSVTEKRNFGNAYFFFFSFILFFLLPLSLSLAYVSFIFSPVKKFFFLLSFSLFLDSSLTFSASYVKTCSSWNLG